jgi:hypothetical protein
LGHLEALELRQALKSLIAPHQFDGVHAIAEHGGGGIDRLTIRQLNGRGGDAIDQHLEAHLVPTGEESH